MKKVFPIILALSLTAIGLSACGGSEKSAEAEKAATEEVLDAEASETKALETEAPETQAPETEISEAEVPPAEITKESWIGTWTAVRFEAEGAVVSGKLANYESSFSLKLNDDNTGSMAMQDDWKDGSWSWEEGNTGSFTMNDKSFSMVMNEKGQIEFNLVFDDSSMNLLFEKGTDPDFTIPYDLSKAVPLTDRSILTGTWKTDAMIMNEVCVEGNMDLFGGFDLQIEWGPDGTGTITMNGDASDLTWTVDENGTSLIDEGTSLSLTQLDDRLLLDFTPIMDGMYLILGKQGG